MQDKWLKLKFGLIAARHHAPAHVMLMDADDCVHRGLAALATEQPHAQGWKFDVGYMYDDGSGSLLRCKNFDALCGTSAIVRLQSRDFPNSPTDSKDNYFILSNGHIAIGDFLSRRGTPLARLPFIGAIYITGTGENDSRFALNDWHGTRAMLKKWLGMRPLTRKIRADFGLYDLSQ
jgi:hypothetical protein